MTLRKHLKWKWEKRGLFDKLSGLQPDLLVFFRCNLIFSNFRTVEWMMPRKIKLVPFRCLWVKKCWKKLNFRKQHPRAKVSEQHWNSNLFVWPDIIVVQLHVYLEAYIEIPKVPWRQNELSSTRLQHEWRPKITVLVVS